MCLFGNSLSSFLLNIFLMKISGMFLSFSSGWLTKEWEWEVHLDVPCFVCYILLESRRCRALLKASNWAHLSHYLELWRIPLPLIPTPNKDQRAYLVSEFKLTFSHFKQHYTHFHTLFHPHAFSKTPNNNSQTTLPKTP